MLLPTAEQPRHDWLVRSLSIVALSPTAKRRLKEGLPHRVGEGKEPHKIVYGYCAPRLSLGRYHCTSERFATPRFWHSLSRSWPTSCLSSSGRRPDGSLYGRFTVATHGGTSLW